MLNKIIGLSIRYKLWVIAAVLSMAMAGVWAALQLKVDAVPDITNNQVQIITSCPSLATQEVEQYVTYPIEQSIAKLPNLVEFRSISRFGLSVVTVVFEDHVNTYFARQLIYEQLKYAEEQIPAGAGKPTLAPLTTGLGEVFQYVVHAKKGSEGKYTAMDLRTLQDWVVARNLYGTKGVAEVNSFGGLLKQYEVAVNPNKLKAHNISIVDIFAALEANNENTGGAYIDRKPNAYFIRGIGTLTSKEDIEEVVLRSNPSGTPLLVRDVCEVKFGSAVRYGAFSYNGKYEAVGGMVLMLKGENSFEVVHNIKERLKEIQKMLPDDVIIEPYLDRTNLINRAIGVVETNLLEGALIVIFVLVVFLGNFRAGLIVASAIPLSLLFALLMMYCFDISANLMSLGAIDFGLIVDGAVIIVEAAMHYIYAHKKGRPFDSSEMDDIVQVSAGKMMSSAVFGQVIILIVYLPILSLSGIEGKMFGPMAQTVGFAIIGALLLSLTYIPVMCAWFLPKQAAEHRTFADKIMGFFERLYTPVLNIAIRWKYAVVSASVVLLLGAGFLFSRMGGEFIPTLQEGDFIFDFILPQGASLSQSVETSMQGARILKEFPEVKMVIGKTGTSEIPMDVMPTEGTDMIVILKDKKEWTTTKDYNELGRLMTEKLQVIPGVFVEQSQPIQMRFNDLMTGVTQDVAVKIFGENIDTLAVYADKVADIISGIDGAGEPKVQRVTGLPQISIEYNRKRIAQYGIDVKTLNQIVSTAFAGEKAGVIFENERRFDLVVRLDTAYKNSIEDVKNLFVPLPDGSQIPLAQLADIDFKNGPAEIGREEGKRRVVVGFNLKGRDVQSVVQELQAKLNKSVKLPTGYYFTYGGTFENLQKATSRLMIALPIALLLIFILLYFAFGKVSQALLIFTAIPMSAIGGIFALMLRDMPFSISAGVGFIALFGVAVLNGIVLISTFNDLVAEGMTDIVEIIKKGTRSRLRPVLMTAAVASLGFLPMALSSGAGAEVQKPLATVVIGGLVTATLLTLIVLPLLYLLFNRRKSIPMPPMPINIAAILLLLANTVSAQQYMSLEEAINKGFSQNLGLKSAEISVQQARQQQRTAWALPKTGFFYENEDLQPNNSSGILKIGLSQGIDFPTVYAARKQLYREGTNLELMSYEYAKNQLRKEIRLAYYELWFAQNTVVYYQNLDSLYTTLSQAAELRKNTGEGSGLEQIAARAQQKKIANALQTAKIEAQKSAQQLAVLLNSKDIALPMPKAMDKIAVSVADSDWKQNPSLRIANQRVIIAQSEKKVMLNEQLPDVWARVFSQKLYKDSPQPFTGFSISLNVPLFTRSIQKNRTLALNIEKEKAAQTAEAQIIAFRAEQLKLDLAQEENKLQYFEQTALNEAKEIRAAASLAYRSGEISYAELAQYLAQAADIEYSYLNALLAYNRRAIELLFLNNQ
jgi:heavy metal efflux system protein